MSKNRYQQLCDEVLQLKADAKRWDYVRKYLTRSMSLHMDGTAEFRIGALYGPKGLAGRARNIDEAMDRLIADMEEHQKNEELRQASQTEAA